VRIGTLPTRIPALLEALPPDADCEAYPTLGVVRAWLDDAERLPALQAMGAVVEAAPPGVKNGIDVFGAAPPSLALMRRLKAELDPNGVLSPGRFVGRL
jgi:FAD/FMN-containing dehydrogenase